MDIGDWLRGLGLAQYAPAFREHAIDADVLSELTEGDLQGLGVPLGHRKRLLRAIRALGAAGPAAEPPPPAAPPPALDAPHLAERRQLTVLFCDLVGSTALSARLDPEDLREVVGAYHQAVSQVVRRYEGFVAKYLGDGVLAYFGYPRAHEDDAERAARAGLDTVAAVGRLKTRFGGRLEARVGIATGLVVVGDLIGEGASQEQAVVGETPNLAARLQALARPGTVVVPGSTRRLLGNVFRLRGLGRHELKGLPEAVEAWAVDGIAGSESRFEQVRAARLAEFVGRKAELGLLMDRWDLAQGGEGQVVLLCGEPGIGKSRILGELRARLEAEGAGSLRFQCSPYHVNSAFYPIIDNFERALRFDRDEAPEARLDKLEALMLTGYGRPRGDVRLVASILSIPCEARYGAVAMTPQRFKDEALRALADTVEAAARKRPTVLLFEDAHWADPTTLETIDLLVGRVARVPLLVVLTHRPEFQPRWSNHGHVTAVTLTRLTRTQSATLVSDLTGGKALPPDLLEQILTKTDGVPLFVEELTKSVLESAALRDAGERYGYSGGARALAIPVTLRDSLMARLDRFAPVREVAQVGAAIGHTFSHELVVAVAPHPGPELDQALDQLTASGLAFRQGTPPEAAYTFKHALVRDAAYDSLLKGRRQELHGKIARVIEERYPATADTEPELLAHHYTEARQPERAVPLWHRAGELALRRVALAEAIAHLNKGVELVAALAPSAERDGMELDLRTTLGTAWMALRGWQAEQVWDSLHPALGLARALRRADALLPILWGLYVNVLTTGRVAESLRWATQIMEAAETHHDLDFWIVGHLSLANSYFWLGEPIKAREHADQVLSLYTEGRHDHLLGILNHDPKTFGLIRTALVSWMLGYNEQAIRIGDTRDAYARQRRHPFDLGFALTEGAWVFDHLGEPEELLKRAEEADQMGRENSLPIFTEFMVPVSSGIALIRMGQLAEGIASIKAGLSFFEQVGGRLSLPYIKSVLAQGLAQTGDLDGALNLIEESMAQAERPGWEERWYYAETLRIKGGILALKGDASGAERNYVASLDWARRQQAKSWELRTAMSYARLMRDQGRTKEAYDLLAPVYAWFTEDFGTKDLRDAKTLLLL